MKGIISVLLLIWQLPVISQVISGKIMDENSNLLSFVNIGIIDLNLGTISSIDGTYQMDITDVDRDRILRFSSVGFERADFTITELRNKKIEILDIILKKKVFRLKEVVVKPKNIEPIFLGSSKKGRHTCVWNEAMKGAEIGTLFEINKPIFLEKFDFHVKISHCDSIYYRLRIYNGTDKYPKELINTKDIIFISKIKKGWETIDLSNYNIKINTDFIITLETLNCWPYDKYKTSHLSVRSINARSYSRESSMAKWTQFGDQMSFRITIREY